MMRSDLWILYDKGKIGTLRQCEALAYPIAAKKGLQVRTIDVELPLWLSWMIPHITRYLPKWLVLPKGLRVDLNNQPPVLIIAAGRKAILVAAALARHIPTVVLLNPKCPAHYFDVVVPPTHDAVGTCDPNVIETLGSLNPFSLDLLTQKGDAADAPYTMTVLIGGNSRHYTFQESDFKKLGLFLRDRVGQYPGKVRLLITASRRTPREGLQILENTLARIDVSFWPVLSQNAHTTAQNTQTNPYMDYLCAADEIIVTGDSISMVSEACFFGKPVSIWQLPIRDKRFLRFYDSVIAGNYAVFAGTTHTDKAFIPLRERDRVLPLVLAQLEKNKSKI